MDGTPSTPPNAGAVSLADFQQLIRDIGAQQPGFKFFWNLDCMAQKGWVRPDVYRELTE